MCIGGKWSTSGKMFNFKANRAGIWCATAYLSPNAGKEGKHTSLEALRGSSPAGSVQAPSCGLMFSLPFSPFYHCESEGGRENHMTEVEFLVYLLWAVWFVLWVCCAWKESHLDLLLLMGELRHSSKYSWLSSITSQLLLNTAKAWRRKHLIWYRICKEPGMNCVFIPKQAGIVLVLGRALRDVKKGNNNKVYAVMNYYKLPFLRWWDACIQVIQCMMD